MFFRTEVTEAYSLWLSSACLGGVCYLPIGRDIVCGYGHIAVCGTGRPSIGGDCDGFSSTQPFLHLSLCFLQKFW